MSEHFDARRFGAAILVERQRRGLNLRDAAEESGVAFNTLSRIERGADMHIQTAAALAVWAGLRLDAFVGGQP